MAMDGDRTESAGRRVYLDLRRRIVGMEMRPGEKIVEREIAVCHGTSRTPVHEAVQRLAEEGLVEIFQRVGTFVARIPLGELQEAMLARSVLETAMVERAAAKATAADRERLEARLSAATLAVAAGDAAAFHAEDERFHELLTEIAGLPGFWRLIQQTKTQVDRYRRLTLSLPGRMESVVKEHRAIAAAVMAGDGDRAKAAMRGHLDQVLPQAEAISHDRPDYFLPPGG